MFDITKKKGASSINCSSKFHLEGSVCSPLTAEHHFTEEES